MEVSLKFGKGVDINQRDKSGRTPLWLACANGDEEVVQVLLSNSNSDSDSKSNLRVCDVTLKSIEGILQWNGKTAAQIAKMRKLHQIADLIDEYDINPDEWMWGMRKKIS